ncbi:SDR family oxidoreductase [Halomonas koreensis]|uniref:SDR family oxidoreductase n=1 Tax=Halomonas koreensis TaxID=245385 RepID=A0ABU1FXT8_9GAMM|nr:SDR family oxidoreductase [Halomonas koreensis]MDR5865500.1 SDR family oxidoreductase [Halomonas koreensis]
MSKTILIIGATSDISSAIIEHLKDTEHRVLALVRNPDKAQDLKRRDVELRTGDLEKPWTLGAAFEGADTVWILTPPGPRAPEQSSNALWAARNAGVSHVVRLSAFGAAHTAPTINGRLHALSDAELIASGIPYTIVKPHFFMQNLLMAAREIAEQGQIHLPLANGRMGLIDSRDIAEFAAQVLTTSGHEGKTYTLTGPASLTMHQISQAIGAAIEKDVQYEPVTLEDAWQSMLDAGMDEWSINLLCDYFAAYSTDWGNRITEDFSRVTGKAPRSIADFAGDFANYFTK